MNAMQAEEIQQLIEAGLTAAEVYVEGDGTHFTALVITPAFEGQSRLKRQQMVYDTVRPYLLDGRLHALSIKALTPTEWEDIDRNEAAS
jgi:acid stress-induced BolA-like protein IbaG/YrbA